MFGEDSDYYSKRGAKQSEQKEEEARTIYPGQNIKIEEVKTSLDIAPEQQASHFFQDIHLTTKQIQELLKLIGKINEARSTNYQTLKKTLLDKIPDYAGKHNFNSIFHYIINRTNLASKTSIQMLQNFTIINNPISIYNNPFSSKSKLSRYPTAILDPHSFPTNIFIANFFKQIFYGERIEEMTETREGLSNLKQWKRIAPFFSKSCSFSINTMEYDHSQANPEEIYSDDIFHDYLFNPLHENCHYVSRPLVLNFISHLFPEGFLSRPMRVSNYSFQIPKNVKLNLYFVVVHGVFYKLIPTEHIFGFDMNFVIKYTEENSFGYEIQNLNLFIRNGPENQD